MVVLVATIIGALIPTFLVSRLLLWVFKRLSERIYHIPLSHILSLIICVLAWGFGTGEGGFAPRVANMLGPGIIIGLFVYTPGQVLWTIFDFWRIRKKQRQVREGQAPNNS